MGSFFVYQHYSVTTILQVATPISILKNVILGSSLQYRSSKITPSFFVDKASCTRQFESEFSLHSLASLFPIKEVIFLPLRLSCKERLFSKTYPSFLTVKEGFFLPLRLSCKESSTFLTKPLFPQGREDVTALWCSEPLRYKVGGPSKVSPCCAGWDRMGADDFN